MKSTPSQEPPPHEPAQSAATSASTQAISSIASFKKLARIVRPAHPTRNITEARRALKKELADFEKRMADTITAETRALLKKRFP